MCDGRFELGLALIPNTIKTRHASAQDINGLHLFGSPSGFIAMYFFWPLVLCLLLFAFFLFKKNIFMKLMSYRFISDTSKIVYGCFIH